LPLENVTVQFGDTDFPAASVSGGSTTTTSLSHAVAKACTQVHDLLARAAVASADSPHYGQNPTELRLSDERLVSSTTNQAEPLAAAIGRLPNGRVDLYVENIPAGGKAEMMEKIRHGQTAMVPPSREHYSAAFGAQLVEVRVHALTCEMQVTRLVGAFAAGRIIDQLTAHSQLLGGMVFGLGSVLHETSALDPKSGRYMNNDLERYLLPVNADVQHQQAILIEDDDREVNPMGIKGLGELGLIGVNAAVCNAVYHATGKRIRSLPLRIEALLE
jgi:xanthine dehydrogenase YagR molybdenum-binding subunit